MAKKGKDVIVTGVREIDRKLRRLEYKVQRKIVVDAMKRGLTPLLNEVKANAPVDTGAMRENIKIRAGKGRKGLVKREVRVGDKQMGADFHAQHVEFGTENAPPHPFMGPAFESHGPDARDRVEREILAGVMQEVGR
jgi:HK97 gp10 family phage protein